MQANDVYEKRLNIGDTIVHAGQKFKVKDLIGCSFDGARLCVFVSDTTWFDISEVEKCE